METLLGFIKVLSVLIAGGLGIIGTRHDFKSRGKLTRWGRWTIAGIVISSIFAIGAQLMEGHLANVSALEAASRSNQASKKLEAIVGNLERDLQLIDRASASISIVVPVEDPHFAKFRRRFTEEVAAVIYSTKNNTPLPPGPGVVMIGSSAKNDEPHVIDTVGFTQDHSAFPARSDTEPCVLPLLTMEWIHVYFFREPRSANELASLDLASSSDLQMGFSAFSQNFHWSKQSGIPEYKLTSMLKSDPDTWRDRTGLVLAVPDLVGTQMVLVTGSTASNAACTSYRQIKSQFKFNRVIVQFNAREFNLAGDEFTKHELSGGTAWEYRFPLQR